MKKILTYLFSAFVTLCVVIGIVIGYLFYQASKVGPLWASGEQIDQVTLPKTLAPLPKGEFMLLSRNIAPVSGTSRLEILISPEDVREAKNFDPLVSLTDDLCKSVRCNRRTFWSDISGYHAYKKTYDIYHQHGWNNQVSIIDLTVEKVEALSPQERKLFKLIIDSNVGTYTFDGASYTGGFFPFKQYSFYERLEDLLEE